MTEALESGGVGVAVQAGGAPEALDRTCREIIDAVSALTVNLDVLAHEVVGEKRAAAEDAQLSVVRIIGLAKFLRRSMLGAKAPA
jgi:hypothetical protein